jgi:hypothetical protein
MALHQYFDGEQLYLFHCHILEHEDTSVMIIFSDCRESSTPKGMLADGRREACGATDEQDCLSE